MEVFSMKDDIKKVRVRRHLLCADGPKGGYPVGSEFEYPFPAGIARQLRLDRQRILAGAGALAVLEFAGEAQEALVPKTLAPKVVARAAAENILLRRFDHPYQAQVVFRPPHKEPTIEASWLSEYPAAEASRIRELLHKRFSEPRRDTVKPSAASPAASQAEKAKPSVNVERPACLDGDKVSAVNLAKVKRQLRDYATKVFGTKIDARQSIDKMIHQILAMEAGL